MGLILHMSVSNISLPRELYIVLDLDHVRCVFNEKYCKTAFT